MDLRNITHKFGIIINCQLKTYGLAPDAASLQIKDILINKGVLQCYYLVRSLRMPMITPTEMANINTMVDITIPKGDVGTPPSQLTQMTKAATNTYILI